MILRPEETVMPVAASYHAMSLEGDTLEVSDARNPVRAVRRASANQRLKQDSRRGTHKLLLQYSKPHVRLGRPVDFANTTPPFH